MRIVRTVVTHRRVIAKHAKRYLAAGAATGLVATQVDGMEPDCPTDWLRYIALWPGLALALVIALAFSFLPDWALDIVFGKVEIGSPGA